VATTQPDGTATTQPDGTFTFVCRNCKSTIIVGPRNRRYQFWVARCANCGLQVEQRLPSICKKIIYLDQNVFSHILSGQDQRWQEAARRLNVLSYLQVVTCPYSEIHREESLLADHSRDQLKGLYRDLSEGNEFLSTLDIEQNQLLRSIRRYLQQEDQAGAGEEPDFREFCRNDPNHWTVQDQVYADFPTDLQAVARLQQRKVEFQSDLDAVASNWKGEDGRRFNEDVERVAHDYGRSMMEFYRELADASKNLAAKMPAEMAEMYRHFTGGGKFDPNTPPGIQPGVRLVHWLAVEVHKARPEEPDPASVVEQFFQSCEATQETPFIDISSRLWAGVAQQARTKTPRSPEGNDKNDISAISHFAPYCDAMVVDNFFRELASQRKIGVAQRYDVQLFSARTLPAFIHYLDELLANIPIDHRKAVKAVIPNLAHLPLLQTP